MSEPQFQMLKAKSEAIAAGGSLFGSDLTEIGNFSIDLLQAGEPEKVLALLEPLRTRVANVARLWHTLATAYRALQRTGEALDAIRKAVQIDPRNAPIANAHATISLEAGERSSSLFKTALALSGSDLELKFSAAAALGAEGNVRAAETILERVVKDHPNLTRAHDALSTIRWIHHGPVGFDRSYATAPNDLGLRLAWYRAVAQIGERDRAMEIVADARRMFGPRPELDLVEAHLASESGDIERANGLFNSLASRLDPASCVSHVRHCLRTGQVEKAELLALANPPSSVIWPYLSLIWRLKGDPRAQWLDGEPPYFRVIDLDYSADELEALAGHLRRLHVSRFHPPEQSMRGGTQTEGNLLLRIDPEIRLLRERLVGAIRDYVDALPPHDPTHPLLGAPRNQLLFVGSWSVRLTQQGFHVCHTHQQGWISSAFYVSLPKLDQMGPAPAGWLELGAPPQDLRVDLPAYAKVEPKPGRLVLFPSTMWHGTVPFNDGERLTVAFDVARTIR